MADDIVTRLRNIYTLGQLGVVHEAADEIERLRALLDVIVERENIDNARQLQIVRKVEADRDMWKRTCTKLVGMMLPYSLLMNETEREELKIILGASNNE